MILAINVLDDAAHLDALRERIALLEWRDGRETAGSVARKVKRNLQGAMDSVPGRALQDELSRLLGDHPVVKAAAQPRRFSPLMISKTGVGGHYGAHVDNALMGRGATRLRTDLSFTLFLTPVVYLGLARFAPPRASHGERLAAEMKQAAAQQTGEFS